MTRDEAQREARKTLVAILQSEKLSELSKIDAARALLAEPWSKSSDQTQAAPGGFPLTKSELVMAVQTSVEPRVRPR